MIYSSLSNHFFAGNCKMRPIKSSTSTYSALADKQHSDSWKLFVLWITLKRIRHRAVAFWCLFPACPIIFFFRWQLQNGAFKVFQNYIIWLGRQTAPRLVEFFPLDNLKNKKKDSPFCNCPLLAYNFLVLFLYLRQKSKFLILFSEFGAVLSK